MIGRVGRDGGNLAAFEEALRDDWFKMLGQQSAYKLRARDPLFAANWGAACELARMPLADALYELRVIS